MGRKGPLDSRPANFLPHSQQELVTLLWCFLRGAALRVEAPTVFLA